MYNGVLLKLLLLVGLFWSCHSENKKSPKKITSCAYIPKDNTLEYLDSIILLNNENVLDSICINYRKKNIETQIYFNSILIKHYTHNYNLKKAKILIRYNDSLYKQNKIQSDLLNAQYLESKGVFYSYNYQLDSAILYINKAISIYNKGSKHLCKELLYCYKDMSIAHFYFGGKLDSARFYLKKQENLFDKDFVDHEMMYSNYYIQANIHKKLLNHSLSLTYVNLAIKELEQYENIDSTGLSLTYGLKADIEYQYNLFKQSVEDNKKSISYLNNNNLKVKKNLYVGIINVLTAMDSIELCYKYIDTLYSIEPSDINTIALTYKLKATIDENHNKLIEAKNNYLKAIKLYESNNLNAKYFYAETCLFYSDVLRRLKKYDKAIEYGKKAIYAHFDTSCISFSVLSSDPRSINFLSGLLKTYSYKYKDTNNAKDKLSAIKLYSLTDSLIIYSYNHFDDDVINSNQSDLDNYYYEKLTFYSNIYSKSNKRKYLNEIVGVFNEYKGKALLRERLLNNSNLGTNDSIFMLKRKVDEIKYNIEEKNGKKDSLNYNLNRTLKNLEFYSKRKTINYKTGETNNLLDKIENYCTKNKCIIIDYFIPDNISPNDLGYIFISDGLSSNVIQITDIQELNSQCDSLYYLYSSYSKDTSRVKNLELKLYNKLLFFIDKYERENIESIVIIPDENLCKVPFELLGTTNEGILLNKFDISYGYSIDNLLLSKKYQSKNNKVLVFAHSDSNTILGDAEDDLSEIPGSFIEAKAIKNIYKNDSKCFTGYNATKENFIKYAHDFSIVHLALHGKSDQNSRFKSKIYFRKYKKISELYPHELMKYRIRPDLLVLSACETANGKLIGHESMYSVSRAFYASGAKKIISSLWELDDEASKKIFRNFYSIISKNKSISYSKALRQSKLKYLNSIKYNSAKMSLIGNLVLYK